MDRPDNRLALGRGGLGKSSLVWQWIEAHKGRVLIFDPNSEFHYEVGAQVVRSKAELVHLLMSSPPTLRVCFRGTRPRTPRYEGDFEMFNRVARAAENCLIVWEEVDSWFKTREVAPVAFEIVNQGRHRNLRTIAVSRRPARVARDLTANAQKIACFHTREPRDLAYLAEFVGQEAAAKLPDLPRFRAVEWTEERTRIITTRPLPKKNAKS